MPEAFCLQFEAKRLRVAGYSVFLVAGHLFRYSPDCDRQTTRSSPFSPNVLPPLL